MSDLDLAALAREILPHHRHVEEDCWYCCGLCDEDGGCCDDSQRGKCNCFLEQRRAQVVAVLQRAVAAEREACAQVAEWLNSVRGCNNDRRFCVANEIAAAIRARGVEEAKGL